MEYVDLQGQPFFAECAKVIRALGLSLIELNVSRKGRAASVAAVIAGMSGTSIDDCVAAHQLLEGRLKALLGASDLQMQVSSPGITRTLKHAGEFKVFEGRMARVWHIPQDAWVEGRIISSTDEAVILEGKEGATEYMYRDISKAKLLPLA